MPTKKEIGKSLQQSRKDAGFKTAKSFAEHMGYNVGTYTNWEQGKQIFSFEQACDMADALGCTLDELAGRKPPKIVAQAPAHTREEEELLDSFRRMQPHERTAVSVMAASLSQAGAAEQGALAG